MADYGSFEEPTNTSSFNEGRSYGRGRGFTPGKVDNDDWSTIRTQSSSAPSTGVDDWLSGGGGNNDNDDQGYNQDRQDRDEPRKGRGGGRGGRGGRGGSRGGRGGYDGGRRDDRQNGSRDYNSRRRNDNNDDPWGNNNQNDNQNDAWGTDNQDRTNDRNNDDWGSGGNQDQNNDDWNSDNKDDNRRNRGSRRNRDDDNNNQDDQNNEDENGEPKKTPVTYIPPEENEDEFFDSGVAAGINFSKYDDITVNVTGEDVPPHIKDFDSANLRTALLDNIKKSGYQKPTPVQKYAIPIILKKRDLMACAQTGSGKTAAYLIPIIHHLLEDLREVQITERGCEPQVIIMAPTRELVMQICNEGKKFAKGTMIQCIPCYGGVKPGYQADQLRRGAHIVVATPGRLNDFVQGGRVKFSSIRFMVLDEADRMLDQGFLNAMEQILEHESMVPAGERQTLMFSATFDQDIQQLAVRFLKNYVFLAVGIVGGACTDVEQNFYEVKKTEKRAKLKQLLEEDELTMKKKTLVFVETQKTADFIAAYMSEQKFPSTSIHGAREQRERELALRDFRSGRMPILIATSVAARGLDIQNVTHVINYDLPKSIEEYVHRIGRTGRVGNRGRATSFYNPDMDTAIVPQLVNILKQAGQSIPPFFEDNAGDYDGGRTDNFGGYDIRDNYNQGDSEPQESW
ncbi:ATP-dependent RNA helicase vasa [Chelonus insularis]|uniref:ATP-dependent RNA helicase vasa n=1 Tax=Chelonus insularis TaxID=460826 RepID=UPI00158C446F|nr:ATP-dependent RNA helicase vasa [Chelonus insularis]